MTVGRAFEAKGSSPLGLVEEGLQVPRCHDGQAGIDLQGESKEEVRVASLSRSRSWMVRGPAHVTAAMSRSEIRVNDMSSRLVGRTAIGAEDVAGRRGRRCGDGRPRDGERPPSRLAGGRRMQGACFCLWLRSAYAVPRW